MITLIIIELILIIVLIYVANEFFNIVFRGFAPFFTTSSKVIDLILKELKINDSAKVYELGAGKSKFLQAVGNKYPKVNLVGIEYAWLPYLISKFSLGKNNRIKLIRANFFKTSLKEADIIYCYLVSNMMLRLGEKIKAECRPGTKIISYMFSLPNLELQKKIEDNGDTIYFYEI